ncbi:MAG: polyprenyl synthetase family protein [Thermoguttaceae bacterium]|nr:polyprenyl synthetase family protein [Thermoguttaceae bacterium]
MTQATVSAQDYVDSLRQQIDEYLARSTMIPPASPRRLRDAMRYSLLLPGKRLRPIMTMLASQWCGGDLKAAVPVAAAVEMIHCYSLIHDDLPAMDNDDLRRGQPTNHKQFDEATAILAGDALLTLAFETIASGLVREEQAARCCLALARAAGPVGMVGGQEEDIIVSGQVPLDAETLDSYGLGMNADQAVVLRRIHAKKTAALLGAALELGALVAGGDHRQVEALRICGRSYGLAFQITDDLLDVTGTEAAVGKRLHKDAESGKLTFVSLYGVEKCRELARTEAEQAVEAIEAIDASSLAGRTLVYLVRQVIDRQI